MSDFDKFVEAFSATFGIEREKIENLEYQGIEQWDSVGHMQLIAELEDSFNIMFDTDDIIDFSSFQKGKEILRKYKVNI